MESAFNLKQIQEMASQGQVRITKRASTEAQAEYGFSLDDIIEEVLSLRETDYKQTIVSDTTGRKNDVYIKKVYAATYGKHIQTYIKMEINQNLIVISFHSS